MRDIEKLLRKISNEQRQALLSIVDILLSKNHKGLAIPKLKRKRFLSFKKRSIQNYISL